MDKSGNIELTDNFDDLLLNRVQLEGVKGLKIPRLFTKTDENVFDNFDWQNNSSIMRDSTGLTVFEMDDVEVPKFWSQVAIDVLAQKYFRKQGVPQYDKNGVQLFNDNGTPILGSEKSLKQVVHRLAGCWTFWGKKYGYFASEEDSQSFYDELSYMLISQMAAPNSPQWFNTGLNYVYGITGPSQGHYYYDPDSKQVVKSQDEYSHPQSHACFIQPIRDDLVNEGGIMDLWVREARIFKLGSGTGTNFSSLRGKGESLSGGGKSSGVMSFLRIGDTVGGSIKSGGTTRRAAKMVVLNVDHPEIEDFINWKMNEELKVAALVNSGYSSDFEGEAYQTVSGQNSNNSVRMTDGFLRAVLDDRDWDLTARTDGHVMKSVKARDLWDKISNAAWYCADPGLQFDTTCNDWNTCPETDRINATNPCSEYNFIDNTACNLASLNLSKFFDSDKLCFDIPAFKHAIRLWTIVLEISVLMAQYPSQEIAINSYKTRTLGLGFTNLGSILMVSGLPYDSDEARSVCSSVTAIMTGESYATSAELACLFGPFAESNKNREHMLKVIRNHRRVVYGVNTDEFEDISVPPTVLNNKICPPDLLKASKDSWDRALTLGERFGYRNAQTTLIAPTGTISLVMDCDTTGIEPDFALVKFKKLVGGGYFKLVNQSISASLKNLGYSKDHINEIIRYIAGSNSLKKSPYINESALKKKGFIKDDIRKVEKALSSVFEIKHAFVNSIIGPDCLERLGIKEGQSSNPTFNLLKVLGFSDIEIEAANDYVCGSGTIEGAPHLKEEHYPIFDCSTKCGKNGTRFINYMAHVDMMAASQPLLSGSISKTINMPNHATVEEVKTVYMDSWKKGLKTIALYRDGCKLSQPLSTKAFNEETENLVQKPSRRRLPDERKSITHKFRIGTHEGYLHLGLYEDNSPGELFITMSKQGSTLAGLMDSFATSVSISLQYGVPLKVLVDKFVHTRFEPSGWTNNPQIRVAKSLMDYIFRWIALKFLPQEDLTHLGFNEIVESNGDSTSNGDVESNGDIASNGNLTSNGDVESNGGVEINSNDIAFGPLTSNSGVLHDSSTKTNFDVISDAPTCTDCGSLMRRSGSCYLCSSCGSTTGCS